LTAKRFTLLWAIAGIVLGRTALRYAAIKGIGLMNASL
jgi:hypothetical protein